MQIVIDIPEEVKHNVNAYGLSLCPRDKEQLINAIKNGTPLPKQDKFDHQAKWLLNGLKIQINALADEKGNQLDLEDVMKIIDANKEQE